MVAGFVAASDSKSKGDFLKMVKGAQTPEQLLALFDPRNKDVGVRGLQELLKKTGEPLFQDLLDVKADKILTMKPEELGKMLGIDDTRRV